MSASPDRAGSQAAAGGWAVASRGWASGSWASGAPRPDAGAWSGAGSSGPGPRGAGHSESPLPGSVPPGSGLCDPGPSWPRADGGEPDDPDPDADRGADEPALAARLTPAALDALMPMHALIDAQGRIRRHGPMLSRLLRARPGAGPDGAEVGAEVGAGAGAGAERGAGGPGGAREALVGVGLFDAFAFRRPRGLASVAALREACGVPLHLSLRADPPTQITGLAVGQPSGGVLLNLSFGLGVVEAVRRHRLTATDFAPTDMAIAMLYLVEANAAVMAESRDLVERLQGARLTAEAEAQSDALTGLRNRRALDQVLADLLRRAQPFALMAVDLDRFKAVNDTLGHAAGDHVLREAAGVMLSAVRAGDVVARAGGDEFVILFPGLVRAERLGEIAGQMIEGIERPMRFGGMACAISASIGITTTAAYERPDAERMTADADAALYASKKDGRGRATIWTPRAGEGPGEGREPSPRVALRPLPQAPDGAS